MIDSQVPLWSRSFADWVEATLGFGNAQIEKTLAGGNSNLTQLVRHDQGLLVMRSAPAETISPKAHLGVEREARFMAALSDCAQVPKVAAWCNDTTVIGRPFALVEYIDGISITDELPCAYGSDFGPVVSDLGVQMATSLGQIARAPWREIGLQDMGRPDNFLRRQIERWLGVRDTQHTRELPQMQALGRWLLDNLPQQAAVGVVHGDFHLDNTLCDPRKPELLAVIDWEMGTIGDPLTDLGLLLMFWGPRKVSPPGFAHVQAVSRVEGIVPRAQLVQAWHEASGIEPHNLNFYLCYAFWRLAAIVEGAYGLYLAGKVDTPYARGLKYDVPALLDEAAMAARGDW